MVDVVQSRLRARASPAQPAIAQPGIASETTSVELMSIVGAALRLVRGDLLARQVIVAIDLDHATARVLTDVDTGADAVAAALRHVVQTAAPYTHITLTSTMHADVACAASADGAPDVELLVRAVPTTSSTPSATSPVAGDARRTDGVRFRSSQR